MPAANGGIDCTGDTTETHTCNLGGCAGKGSPAVDKYAFFFNHLQISMWKYNYIQFQLIVFGLIGKLDHALQPVVLVNSYKPDT